MTKIAIIEQDPALQQLYRMKFETDGFDAQVADDGETGLALVNTLRPHVILLDADLPGLNTAETLRQIRSQPWCKRTPVVVLSHEAALPKALSSAGVEMHLVRADHTPRQVVTRVKQMLKEL